MRRNTQRVFVCVYLRYIQGEKKIFHHHYIIVCEFQLTASKCTMEEGVPQPEDLEDLGDMCIRSAPNELMSLDEPVSETIIRDLKTIGKKLRHVLIPTGGSQDSTLRELRDWDLWGPLLLCIGMLASCYCRFVGIF